MKIKIKLLAICISLIVIVVFSFFTFDKPADSNIVSYTVDAKKLAVKLYWKNEKGELFGSIQHLKQWAENKKQTLLFAMNAGMYQANQWPQGLYIENSKLIHPIDTASGKGNFYLKPNGVFYITTNNEAGICTTANFKINSTIRYATQSGPMLMIDGQIHSAFNPQSSYINIRNGVGILPSGKIIFAISKKEISFYDFANYFKKLGCQQALYLDGFVSRAYIPEKKWLQTEGNFGVMIGIIK